MKHIKKFNEDSIYENKISRISDLNKLKSGKDIDKEIKNALYQPLSLFINKKIDLIINDLNSGKKISEMSDDTKSVLQNDYFNISTFMKKEHPNKTYKSLPQKIKDSVGEDIEFDKEILIEYLNYAKGSLNMISTSSKYPLQRLRE